MRIRGWRFYTLNRLYLGMGEVGGFSVQWCFFTNNHGKESLVDCALNISPSHEISVIHPEISSDILRCRSMLQ